LSDKIYSWESKDDPGQDSETKILVVDDDRALLELLSETLDALGYRAVAAAGGSEAKELLESQTFDLMITDISMPDVDGHQLLKWVRNRHRDLPVLFISGLAEEQRGGSAWADGFVPKPFRISNLEELIENALQAKGGTKVLVVDRDRAFREVLADALNRSAFRAFAASTGEEALLELDRAKFRAIVCEIELSDMPARRLLEAVRVKYPEIEAVVTSEFLSPAEISEELSGLPALGCLAKPFKVGDLVGLLERISERDVTVV
jgi:DNA-binding NtrC family response regulator